MAIFRTGAVVAAISGTVGGQVFVQSARGNVIRSTPNQVSQQTPAQLIQRATLSRWVVAWRTLTSAQRLAWNAAARVRNFPNRLGVARQISGFNLYVKLNTVYQNLGLALLTTPTLMETTVVSPLVSFTYSAAAPKTLTFTRNTNDQFLNRNITMQIRPNSAASPLNNHWVKVTPDIAGLTQTIYYSNILTQLGSFVTGSVYWLRYTATETGKLPSPPQETSVIIT